MSEEKAKYKVLRLSHIHNQLWEEGSEVDYDGQPGSALEPLNDAAKKAKAKATGGKVAVVELPKTDDENTGDGQPGSDDDLDKLREEYELLFNEKPHHNTSAKTLSEKIAEERQRLGV